MQNKTQFSSLIHKSWPVFNTLPLAGINNGTSVYKLPLVGVSNSASVYNSHWQASVIVPVFTTPTGRRQ
ncbi:hypothetical protein SLEP1_g43704 [Rubroshorea leprosula]|uniref:Uncharacterized protein n=1 Tax=Rubroshorea leprosula TaxID=152421 RepID=A0AAV5LEX1_9ROSI|nr:hypothetical protein SLEP1_g43704 [Rubroshorea leprosula]